MRWRLLPAVQDTEALQQSLGRLQEEAEEARRAQQEEQVGPERAS